MSAVSDYIPLEKDKEKGQKYGTGKSCIMCLLKV